MEGKDSMPAQSPRVWRRRAIRISIVFVSLLLGLASSELLLRWYGIHPSKSPSGPQRPTVHEPDPVLGWKNKPGRYLIPAYSQGAEDIRVTMLPGGKRATGPKEASGRKALLLVGCSVTQGQAISDDETYAWKLQSKYPFLDIQNHGTAGYGTFQCLLLLERLFANRERPALVLYGFIENHEVRNVAPAGWLLAVGHGDVPFCAIDGKGNLQRHPPQHYLTLPLREYLSTTTFVERLYMEMKTKGRMPQRRAVTEKLLVQMNELCKTNGAQFAVIVFGANYDARVHYANFFRTKQMNFIDCVYLWTPDLIVQGDGHPNGKLNTLYADRIDKSIGNLVQTLK